MLNKLFKTIITPIINQLPLCVFMYLLWGMNLFVSLFGPLYAYDPKVFIVNLVLEPCVFLFGFLAFMYLFAFLTDFINKKWFKVFIYAVIILLAGIKWLLYNTFGIDITPTTLVLLAETNKNEAIEFIETFVLTKSYLYLIILLPAIICFIFICEKFYSHHRFDIFKEKLKSSYWVRFFVLAVLMYSCYNVCANGIVMSNCPNTDELSKLELDTSIKNPLTEIVYSFYGIYLMNHEESSFENRINNFKANNVSCSQKDSLNIILVIGESYIKHHSSLYGYYLNTNPMLSKEQDAGNLFVFNDVITPYSSTSITVKNVLCTNSLSDGEKWNNSLFFPQLFKAAGYDVFFWDNQKYWGDNSNFAFALNSFLYNKLLVSNVYNQVNKKAYPFDEDIVKSFGDVKLTAKRNLVIFHLLGQHIAFKERFPNNEDYIYFTKDSIIRNEQWMTDYKKQRIADYDNATRYNDYVILQIINLFRDKKSIVVYFSDHGEEVYDYRNSSGRKSDGMSRGQLKYQFEVPLMLWFSDSYRNDNPDVMKQVKDALNRPFMIDNLCQLLFHLGDIKTKSYHSERDLISPNFKPRKRIVLDQYDYDGIMNNKKGD